MAKASFSPRTVTRRVANAADVLLRNRYYEKSPSLTEEGEVTLIARPGMKKLTELGTGPIRGMASEAGSFDGDLFVASGASLYRMTNGLVSSSIYGSLNDPERGVVNMAITARIGDVPEFVFIADGANLLVYQANGFAKNSLTGTPANNDVVVVGTTYYRFTNASVNAGTPAGTNASPWLVNVGVTSTEAFQNLARALNANGAPGTDYSTALAAHPSARATAWSSALVTVTSTLIGALGNSTATTETGAALSWSSGATMVDGGSASVSQVQMPDDVGAIDVAVIASYVIVIPIQTNGYQGRFYWIEPGEIVVDELNFATAERSPDGIYGVKVFGDQFWLAGESTTEVWYVSGNQSLDSTAPVMQRLQGVVIDRGAWQNTAEAIHETMIIVDSDGGVFALRGGSPERVSSPDIEEAIRKAIAYQNFLSV